MLMLSAQESLKWAEAHGIIAVAPKVRYLPDLFLTRRFVLSDKTGKQYWQSQMLADLIDVSADCLLWIVQWGIWESSENWPLYYMARLACGDNLTIEERSGHLFMPSERSALVSFLQISIGSGWDVLVISSDGRALFISHDEWLEVASTSEALRNEAQRYLESAGLQEVSASAEN
jgi:hypothetical protein